MGERSTLDRLAIGGVFIAGIVEASQAALSEAPAVTKSYPVLKLDGLWHFVPLVFITLAAALWLLDIALKIFHPDYAQARAVPVATAAPLPRARFKINPNLVAPAVVVVGLIGLVALLVWAGTDSNATRAAALAASPQMHMAPVIRGPVTLAYIKQVIQTDDAITAETTLSKYLGAQIRVAGIVHTDTTSTGPVYTISLTPPQAVPQVYLLFHTNNENEGLYEAGDHIAAECKIERADAAGLGLDGCALIPDEAWTSKPAEAP